MYHILTYRGPDAFNRENHVYADDGWELVHMWIWENNSLIEVLWEKNPIEDDGIRDN
jgi:hypothetical protein